MRITNNIIQSNSKTNINGNKVLVDKYNTQMTTQKKISRPSDNPVIAIRSLRLATNLTKLNQYADNNIPDAEAWLEVTGTALINMKDILTDVRTQCVYGSTDTLKEDDRNAILTQLAALSEQVYAEGNSDYAGRTIFTGYRTTSMLTFQGDDPDISYEIDQPFAASEIEAHRYYCGDVTVPVDATGTCTEQIVEKDCYRIRLAYDNIDSNSVNLAMTKPDGTAVTYTSTTFGSKEDWQKAGLPIGDNEVVILENTGEIVFGKEVYKDVALAGATIDITYTKTGFTDGDLRPEYYYDCRDVTDANNVIVYDKADQAINYTVAANTEITVNTQASDVFDTSIGRDIEEMIDIVQKSVDAHEKVDKITAMMKEAQFADATSQANLKTYLDAAQKEADYADDNLQKTFGEYITRFDKYLSKVNLALTNVGSTQDRLAMTKNRVENQQTTTEDLKSSNEDREVSDIVIDYYAAYNAYTASLMAAAEVGKTSLLNYL